MHVFLFQRHSFHTNKEIPPSGITMQRSTTAMPTRTFCWTCCIKNLMRSSLVKKLFENGRVWSRYSKAKHKPSGSGTKDIYVSTWEFFPQLHCLDSICDDTDATVDSIMHQPESKSRKRSRVAQIDEREDKKLKLLARAVDAINTPPPSVSQTPLVEKSESVAFGNYVAWTLAKSTPGQFHRAKKLISDVLYDMEEKDGIEQAGSFPRRFPQHTTIGYAC